MNELTQGVSWLGVIVGFVVSFLLGMVWYNPKVFGSKWAKGVGVDLNDGSPFPVAAMIIQMLGTFGLAWLFGITAASNSLLTIILILATIILIVVSNGKYAQKSNAAVAIEGGYILVMGFIMLVCQGIF